MCTFHPFQFLESYTMTSTHTYTNTYTHIYTHTHTCDRHGYIDPVVSKEKTISTGPPGGGGASLLGFFAGEGSSSLFLSPDQQQDREREGNKWSASFKHHIL